MRVLAVMMVVLAGCSGPQVQSITEPAVEISTRIIAVNASDLGDRVRLTIKGSSPLSFNVFRMPGLPKVILDVADADVSGLGRELDVFLGGVTVVRPVQFEEGTYRIGRLEIDVEEPFSFRAESSGNNIVIEIFRPLPEGTGNSAETGPELPVAGAPAFQKAVIPGSDAEKPAGGVEPEVELPAGADSGSGPDKGPHASASGTSSEKPGPEQEKVLEVTSSAKTVPGYEQTAGEGEDGEVEPSAGEDDSRVRHADPLPVKAFGPGERLVFVLKWAGIPAGDSVISVNGYSPGGGVKLYKVVSTARSRSVVDIFYKVRNRVETYIDPSNGLTRKYVVNSREGGRRKERVLMFDQDRNLVTRLVREKGSTSSMVFRTPPMVHDSLSSFYAIRDQELKVGESVSFNVFEGKKNWELVVDVLAREEITIRAGTFKTIKLHPLLKYEGIFRRKGELYVWVTDDDAKIPVLMKSKVKVGSITAELADYSLRDGEEGAVGTEIP